MAKYSLKRTGKRGKVEVRSQHIEIHVPALIICLVLAFLIWLYIVGISQIPKDFANAETGSSETTAAESATDTNADTPVDSSDEAVCLPNGEAVFADVEASAA